MIRPAVPADVPELIEMIGELAEHHGQRESAVVTAEHMIDALFGADPTVSANVATEPGEDGAEHLVGMAVYFRTFSTWTGANGLWLEDLYVRQNVRGGGHGKKLLASLARLCEERGYPRLEWTVLDTNTSAVGFYRSIGAQPQDDWTTQRLTGDALAELASAADGA